MIRKVLTTILLFLTLVIIALGVGLFQLDRQIQTRLEQRMFAPPTEFYTAPKTWVLGQSVTRRELDRELILRQLKSKADNSTTLLRGEFSWLDQETCLNLDTTTYEAEPHHCLLIKPLNQKKTQITFKHLVVFNQEDVIKGIFISDQYLQAEALDLEPRLFAQYYRDKPILRQVLELNQVPAQCLKSVLAIEDPQFLDHGGVSLRGTLRAIVKNVILGDRRAGGGSTITQQLMKNFFLTNEQTYKRKLIEIGMATLFEFRVPKDQILQAYLNIIYMGQSGSFAVHGFGAASQFYFQKDIERIDLAECALLAAILNNPGRYNPTKKPEAARNRRQRVLTKMLELAWISKEDFERADQKPLPTKEAAPAVTAPYFVDAVRRQIRELDLDLSEGARVYTTMVPEAQSIALKAVSEGLTALEDWYASLKKKREEEDKKLQGLLIASNPRTGHIEALVGGRDFRSAPYNRALRAHRQIGSVIKPVVYLAALEAPSIASEGEETETTTYDPLSTLDDSPFTHRYEAGQTWSPRNYSGEFRGSIPMFYSLKNSLNVPTAKLGLSIGLESIIDTAERLGVRSKIEALPAMTLGAYELYANEVLQTYTSIARFGSFVPLTTIRAIHSLSGDALYTYDPEPQQLVEPSKAAVLIGMLKQTIFSGTATGVRKAGFLHPAAGKTGTTSDTRDAWFSGFTPYHVAVTWVGYDENDQHGLTGASGAVPIWTRYMKDYASRFPEKDFSWPENIAFRRLSPEEQLELGVPEPEEDVELIFEEAN